MYIKYLKGTVDFGITYEKKKRNHRILGYSGSDFSSDVKDSKSTSRQVLFLIDLPTI